MHEFEEPKNCTAVYNTMKKDLTDLKSYHSGQVFYLLYNNCQESIDVSIKKNEFRVTGCYSDEIRLHFFVLFSSAQC